MKALEICNKLLNSYNSIMIQECLNRGVGINIKDIDEAIKELEALENRNCDGCKYKDTTLKQCNNHYACIRQILPTVKDYFEPKE